MESHPFTRFLGVICYLTVILYLIELFYPSTMLELTYSLLCAILLACAFLYLSRITRFIVFTLLAAGSICLYAEDISFNESMIGFGKNTNLLSLFLLIPLIGTFMSTAGYLSALKEKVQAWEKKGAYHPYRFSYFLTATIGILLNFGSMAIVKRIAAESFSSYRDKKITLNIMRGFGFGMLWSPYFVNIGLVLVLFELSWFDIGGYAFILAVIYIFFCWLSFRSISFPDDPIVEYEPKSKNYSYHQSLVPFFFFSLILITLSFLLDYLLEVNMLTVVSFLAILLPLVWAVFTKIIKNYLYDVSQHMQLSFNRLKNELAVFISAGFFGMAISKTAFGSIVSNLLFDASFGSIFFLSLIIVTLAIALGQIGVHPVIIVIGIGSSLSPEKFGVSPEYMALLLIIAWTTATQMSPFSGQLLMTSRLMNQPPSVIIKQNYTFALSLAVILTTTIYSFLVMGLL
ncbi:hypothetical protein [Jeotgalibacillus soli]|uniref:Uncharacterized protein n=1 Tax=Jeotgalibacillus soli TaxID=889306 RepID=A0A0C2R1V2_9BACL|nr:hypothetical protein [Jeotgalibacillus soli]KIL44295.1 hypothetical protein KP78_32590 [Jeotgalibacillus soli]